MYKLDDTYENGRVVLNPQQIFIHPRWNPFVQKYEADLAILEPEQSISFNKYISPICLWNYKENPNYFKGTVVGYGKSENKTEIENFPRQIEVPIIKMTDCQFKEPKLGFIASPNMICAGSADGRGVCTGDSGNGLFFKADNKFYLLGIVSSSLLDDEFNCDVTKFALYTDVLKHKDWIDNPSNEYQGIRQKDFKMCKNGQYIHLNAVCDGKFDCIDRSDEDGKLKKEAVVCSKEKITKVKLLTRAYYLRGSFCCFLLLCDPERIKIPEISLLNS